MTILNSELVPVLGVCCHDFASRFGEYSNDTMRMYAEQLIKNEIGRKGLSRGIESLKAGNAPSRFTPTPAEFVEMCKPSAEELGIPSLDDCMHEVRESKGRWRNAQYPFSHEVSRRLSERIGYEFYQISLNQFRKRCETEYTRLIELARNGQLGSHENRLPRHAEERSRIEQMGKQLSINDARDVLKRFGINPFKQDNQQDTPPGADAGRGA
ncbi:replication protein P [Idiomarina aminovorans]|uniref:replication protein P n=1 Tax=Idiomarina aminovorans TaxID=2914829 RepID=UPI0020065E65|nr:replication protein P [Idiomarina sp. ATCH4]MCK7458480.1 hypothetical protein [Idiomarina sp. ATCH4]